MTLLDDLAADCLTPMLYKRTKTGAIQTWRIEINGPKYRPVFGQLDGTLTTGEWTQVEGKNIGRSNQTTPEAQARLEIISEYKKKRDTGYVEDPGKIDQLNFHPPMLAKNYDDLKKPLEFPVFCQPKLDGMRCVTTKDGMFSRNGKPIVAAPHIHNHLRSLFAEFPEIELDGELYNHSLKKDFNKIISLVKKSKPTTEDLEESSKHIQYWIYDFRDRDSLFSERFEWMKRRVASYSLRTNHQIKVVWTHTVSDQIRLDELMDEYLKDGFEGQMIRLNRPYEFVRSASLLKRKLMEESEYEIVDVIEGQGKRSSMAGAIRLKLYPAAALDRHFNSSIIGNEEYCRQLLRDRDKLRGKMATIKYQNLTPDGIPRFPEMKAVRDYE